MTGPAREVGRRRLAALAGAALGALFLGAAVGSGDGGGSGDKAAAAATQQQRDFEAARDAVDRLTLRQQVGQVTISSFPGTTRPEYIRRRLRARETAGVILFGAANGGDAAHWRRLTRSLQRAGHGRALVMVDQEGGDIRAVEHVGPSAGQPFQGAPADVRRVARSTGRGLRDAGVNVNLAPVADVPRAGSVMATRSFAGDERGIAARTRASVRGMRDGGVAATAKHFPGLGAATVNTDDGPATVSSPVERDLVPFRAAIAEGVPLVMLSHASYPALDRSRIASQSRTDRHRPAAPAARLPGRDRHRQPRGRRGAGPVGHRDGGRAVDPGGSGSDPDDGLGELERRLPAPAEGCASRPGVPGAHPRCGRPRARAEAASYVR